MIDIIQTMHPLILGWQAMVEDFPDAKCGIGKKRFFQRGNVKFPAFFSITSDSEQ